ncbi:Dof zinc finger protein DOF4.4 [Senna tora]|uniref:Dof zinc finger protein DOF4.4 n=1 Tax=Senna tora TaxID=362788 RepID=A0A834TFB8_9FABA|nr:Dof zinc finger protein DOF4.4 [Senna tora]
MPTLPLPFLSSSPFYKTAGSRTHDGQTFAAAAEGVGVGGGGSRGFEAIGLAAATSDANVSQGSALGPVPSSCLAKVARLREKPQMIKESGEEKPQMRMAVCEGGS